MTRRVRTGARSAVIARRLGWRSAFLRAALGRHVLRLTSGCPPASFPTRTRATSSSSCRRPRARSLDYTDGGDRRATEAVLPGSRRSQHVFAVGGFSFRGSGPNKGILFVALKPWDERPATSTSAAAMIDRLRGPLVRHRRRHRAALRAAGHPGRRQLRRLPVRARGPVAAASSHDSAASDRGADRRRATQTRSCAASSSTSPRTTRSSCVEVDREKAKALGVAVERRLRHAAGLHGLGRTSTTSTSPTASYRVYVQADQQFRAEPEDIVARSTCARDSGHDDPARGAGAASTQHGAPRRSSATTTCSARPRSTARPRRAAARARRSRAMEALAEEVLPHGHALRVDGHLARSSSSRAARRCSSSGSACSFVFLVLAAQYESFALPFIVMLAVPLAILGALGAQRAARLRQRRLLPDRPGHAGRPRQQERDPDRRVRRAARASAARASSTRRSRRRRSACGRS